MTKKRFNPIHDKSAQIIEFLMNSPDMPKDDALLFKIRLSVEETVENVVNYAYGGGIGWMEAGTELSPNPLDNPDPDITLGAEERQIGGLGIFLCKKMMDEVSYRYTDGCNVLTMKKHIK